MVRKSEEYATLYVVRHAETEWNKRNLIQGHTDLPLTTKGEKQAQQLGIKLRDVKFSAVFSSDLLRAKKTAEIVALERELIVTTTQKLRERRYGRLEGKGREALTALLRLSKALQKQRVKETDIESDGEITVRLIPFLREVAIA